MTSQFFFWRSSNNLYHWVDWYIAVKKKTLCSCVLLPVLAEVDVYMFRQIWVKLSLPRVIKGRWFLLINKCISTISPVQALSLELGIRCNQDTQLLSLWSLLLYWIKINLDFEDGKWRQNKMRGFAQPSQGQETVFKTNKFNSHIYLKYKHCLKMTVKHKYR